MVQSCTGGTCPAGFNLDFMNIISPPRSTNTHELDRWVLKVCMSVWPGSVLTSLARLEQFQWFPNDSSSSSLLQPTIFVTLTNESAAPYSSRPVSPSDICGCFICNIYQEFGFLMINNHTNGNRHQCCVFRVCVLLWCENGPLAKTTWSSLEFEPVLSGRWREILFCCLSRLRLLSCRLMRMFMAAATESQLSSNKGDY